MPLSVSSQVNQLSDGNSAGTVLGTGSTDLIGFYGATPVVRTSGAAQAALTRGLAGGLYATAGSTNTPISAPVNSSNDATIILNFRASQVGVGFSFGLTSTDFLVANKPTQQAGIAYAPGARFVNATQVAVAFSNFTTATVTSTAGETWGVVALRGFPTTTVSLTPAVVAGGAAAEQLFTVPNMRVGEVVMVNPPATVTNVNIGNVRIAAANQVGITFINASTNTATTPAAGTYTFWSTGGIDAVGNVVQIQSQIGSGLPGPPGTAVSSFSYTVTGLLATDVVMGVSKPTQQANLIYGQAFVAAANVLGVSFSNIAATVTPTINETYGVTIFRAQPSAPCIVYSQALTPSAVPPNTTSSQVFTVTGLVNSSMVFVNKATAIPAGVTIMGARVSGTNQLEITYANATTATLTPTAGETYTIANLQQPVPDTGNTWIYSVNPQMQQMAILDNAIRTALAGNGMIAGS